MRHIKRMHIFTCVFIYVYVTDFCCICIDCIADNPHIHTNTHTRKHTRAEDAKFLTLDSRIHELEHKSIATTDVLDAHIESLRKVHSKKSLCY